MQIGKPEKLEYENISGVDTTHFVWVDHDNPIGFFTDKSYSIPEREDLVLFSILDTTADLKSKGIARVIGMPGDTVKIYNGKTYVNGRVFSLEGLEINRYDMQLAEILSEDVFRESFKYTEVFSWEVDSSSNSTLIEFSTTEKNALYIAGLLPVQSMQRQIEKGKNPLIHPTGLSDQNGDNYGPIIVPQSGDSAHLNAYWNELHSETIQDSVYRIFQEDHYFLLNDYRMMGNDSRFFGCLPASDIEKITE